MTAESAGLRSPAVRRALLGIALAITIAAVIFQGAAEDDSSPAPASARDVPSVRAAPEAGQTALPSQQALTLLSDQLGKQRLLAGARADLFDTPGWAPEAIERAEQMAIQKRVAAEPPAPPRAPPLPFTFFGRLLDGDRRQVFLTHRNQTLIVGKGETFDRVYRLDRIEDETLHFTYLPLGQAQVLAIPGAPGTPAGKAAPGNTGTRP